MDKQLNILICFDSNSKAETLLSIFTVAGVFCDYKLTSDYPEFERRIDKSLPHLVVYACGESGMKLENISKILDSKNLHIPILKWTESGDTNYFYEVIHIEHKDYYHKKVDNLREFCEDVLKEELSSSNRNLNFVNSIKSLFENTSDDRTSILIETNDRLQQEIRIRQKIEENLRSTESFLNAILEHIPSAIFVKDAASLKFTYVNQCVTNMLGYTKDDLISKTVYDIYSKELADYYSRKDKEVLITKENLEIEEDIYLTKDNRIRIHNTKKLLIRDENNVPQYILDIAEDVTDKIRNENELRRVDMRFSKLFHSSPVGITVVRVSDMVIIDANNSFLNLIEYTKQEIVNSDLRNLDLCVEKGRIEELIKLSKDSGKLQSYELCLKTKSDNILTVLVSVEFLNFEGDEPLLIFMFLDISERKEAELEIVRALESERELNILKTGFISMISHEFRTPLTSIMLSTDLLKSYSDKWSDADRLKHFNRIQNTVLTMTKLMENVLIIGRLEAGKFEIHPESLDLNSFCTVMAENIEEIYQHENQIVFVNNSPDMEFKLDENLLGLILNNLLTNAMKYSYKNSLVNFEVNSADNFIVFTIRDYGIGIPMHDAKHIFETFHRGSNTASIAGYGLGLSIVSRCIKQYKGTIEFESEEGIGTTFTVKLPNLI